MTRRRGDDGWGGIVDALLVLVLELEFLRLLMMREESRVGGENRVCFDLRHDRDLHLQRRGRVVVGSVQVHRQGQGLGAE